ncbi:MAG: serine hydrolase domain-containing protein [Betaproteobacteria bacterium]|jgi:CubicO group peptidase (beta-lactamase class C family)|nr:beta-lactamase family protein [Betaproteobacteria bacterium]
MKSATSAATALLALACSLSAAPALANDPLPRARPESVGMSSERLARIGPVINAHIEKNHLPGMVVAVARKGRLVYHEAFGWRDKQNNVRMTTDTIFSLASMTKPMAAVGAMSLYEEGRLLIGDPVGRHIPELAKMEVGVVKTGADGKPVIERVPAKRQMVVQDLMRHTAGLTYGARGASPLHALHPASSTTTALKMSADEFINQIAGLPLVHHPGTVWEYSVSIDVLGILLERITGQRLGEILAERIWKPLGMNDTAFSIPKDKMHRYAKALPVNPDTGRPQSVTVHSGPAPKFDCGGACAAGTAGDYLRFAQMLLNRGQLGDARILGKTTVDYMTADHLGSTIDNRVAATDPSRAGYGFGLSMAVRTATGESAVTGTVGDYNWGGANGTMFWVDPKEELVVVYMAHTPGEPRLYYRALMKSLVMQSLIK